MATEYTKDEVRLLASHPGEAQKFIDRTKEHRGASMFLRSKKVIEPGQSTYLVGKEPSQKTGKSVPTEFVNKGSAHPGLSPKQFAQHFLRLSGESSRPTAVMGSWVDEEAPHKGVQVDLSAGFKTRKSAEKKMVERNEDAVWDMKSMANIRHEDVRHKYTDTPRPPKVN